MKSTIFSNFFLLLMAAVLLTSCIDLITGDRNNRSDAQPIYTQSVESIELSNGKISFDLVGLTPNPCWTAASPTYEKTGTTFNITQRGYPSNQPCVDVLGTIETSISLNVAPGTEYTFKFWRFDEATLDTTITIPQF
ncbi:MAG: hypothetical protein LAT67_10715 [Balneolales bacterium]|nr:hypothetical protein [Balneolales bacterium]